jgi:dCMP deaminase
LKHPKRNPYPVLWRLFAIFAGVMTPSKQYIYDRAYLKMAREWGKLSYCKKRQVGALIVKDRMIISDGYNGTPTGFENNCEDDENYTKWYVLHAEANAILKVAASTQSCYGATLYITLSPCRECSKLVHQAGIKRVVYQEAYKDPSGLQFLEKAGVQLQQIANLEEPNQ